MPLAWIYLSFDIVAWQRLQRLMMSPPRRSSSGSPGLGARLWH